MHSLFNRFMILAAVGFVLCGQAGAELWLPSIIGDHMVLQRDAEVVLWGKADAGSAVKVTAGSQAVEGRADAEGAWRVTLSPMPASSEPMTVTIEADGETRTLSDILVGEVWLCSGQSNMGWPLQAERDADIEIASSDYPQVRLFQVDNKTAQAPRLSANASWQASSPVSARRFSAVGYLFGRDVHRVLGCPVGLIDSSWGGTPAEAWTRVERLAEDEATAVLLTEWEEKLAAYPEQRKIWEQEVKEWESRRKAGEVVPPYHQDPGISEVAAGYGADELDATGWSEVRMPSTLENQLQSSRDGAFWYRRTVSLPAAWVGRPLTLRLGAIDDFDVTFVNGVQVGKKTAPTSYQILRIYDVPGDLVTDETLTVAVRVFDRSGTGGFTGTPRDLRLELAGAEEASVSLAGSWLMKAELDLPPASGGGGAGRPRAPQGPDSPHRPGSLANGMLGPVVPYTLRGAIWYQGESNAGRYEQYRVLLPMMIRDWRDRWDRGDFPFGIVQLASYLAVSEEPSDPVWAHLRDAQLETARNVPNVGFAVATDIGEANDIHPRNKHTVGRRLARWALADVYDQEILGSGPRFAGRTMEGNRVLCTFEHVANGLKVLHGGAPDGFIIAGEDQVWHWADAELVGKDGVAVWSAEVPEPVAVRYAWANNPVRANLVNSAQLPAAAFRTDDWPRGE